MAVIMLMWSCKAVSMEELGECKWGHFRVEIGPVRLGPARFARLGSVVHHGEVKGPINLEDLVFIVRVLKLVL